MDVRRSESADEAAIERIYPAAFSDEDLRPLVRALLADPSKPLSLVATRRGVVVGHAVFTTCRAGAADVALLGPLAVDPSTQGRGVGSALVRAGLDASRDAGLAHAFVLGDPAYYERFGFEPTDVEPPCPMPAAWRPAWRSLALASDAPPPTGALEVPPVWAVPAYWAP